MPNFGLLSQTAQVPMQGVPLQMNTPVENQTKRITMEGKQLELGEQQRQVSEESQDRDILKQTLSEDGVDLATPEGTKNLLSKAKGKVSPGMYSKLADHYDKIQANNLKNQQILTNLGTDQLANYSAQLEQVAPELDALDKQYDKTKAEKGQVAAEAEMKERMAGVVGKYGAMKMPNGAPLFAPQILQNLRDAPPDILHATVANTKYMQNQVSETLKREQARRAGAEADILQGGGKNMTTLQDPTTGKLYFQSPTGKTYEKQDGTLKESTFLPTGLVKPGSTQAARASAVKDTPALTQDENEFIAEYQTTTGKQVPGIPAGNGVAATKARTEYLKAFVEMAKNRGYTGDEAGEIALERDASKEALKKLTTNNAVVVAGEQDLKKVGSLLEEEIKKLGGPQSPLIRKYWNKTATDWEGSPEFTGINAAMVNYQETAARVLSGQTGAGGTPVTFLELAKKATGENPNMEQIVKLNETMKKLFTAREQSFEGAREQLLKKISLKDKRADTKVSPEDQAKRDKERAETNQNEYEGEGGLEKARRHLKEVNDGIRASKDQTSKVILMDEKKRIEGAITRLESKKKEPKGAGPFDDAEKEQRYQEWKKSHAN